jgi:hypothetical protein
MALIPLSSSDPTRLHPDAFDVRGWEVRTEVDDDKAGSVDDVLMDSAGTPHLLDVDLGALSRHVLVPLSQAWADASRRVIWVEGLSRDDLKRMPSYDHRPDALTNEFETKLVDDYAAISEGTRRKTASRPTDGRLARLAKGEEFHVSKGSSDPRGWKVLGGDGAKFGKVTELILDREDMRVRYLDVDVDEDKLGLERIDRHVLVPIERARLDHKHKAVVLDGLFARDLTAYPVFTGLPLAKGFEDQVMGCFRGHERRSDGWVDAAAQRFFRGGRQRISAEAAPPAVPRAAMPPRAPLAADVPPQPAAPSAASVDDTVVRPREGEEVRIRVSGGDIIIEKHPGGTDHG